MIRNLIIQDINNSDISIDTYGDWGLILNNKEIPLPTPKTELVEIEGGDGTIDLSEATGDEVKYKDRINTYTFTLLDKFMDLPSKISQIANRIHGKRFKIFHYDDPDYYYIGRLSINDYKIDKATGSFVLEATCNPYKYKMNKTYVEKTVDGTETITLHNERKRVVPKITTDSTMQLFLDDKNISMSEGTFEYVNLYLNEGETTVTVKGNGTIKFEYQEASL
jgi:phage-related protein